MSKLEAAVWAAFLQWIIEEGKRHDLSTMEAIGKKADVQPSTISRWGDAGENGPGLNKVVAVADAIGVSMAHLGAVLDHAREREGAMPPLHAGWPRLDDAVTHAPDIESDSERELIREAIKTTRQTFQMAYELGKAD